MRTGGHQRTPSDRPRRESVDAVVEHLEARIRQVDDAHYNAPDARPADAYREIRRTLIAIEAAELQRLFQADRISNATRRG